jgi:hypothetical protein
MTIFNTIVEANQHARQIALDASGASADIRVAVANDDCTNRVPAGAVKRLQQSRTVYVKVPVVPLPASLTADTPQPEIRQPDVGPEPDLNVSLLSALGSAG